MVDITMTCLSLWQPWASLLVAGLKLVETRSWPMRHRGPLLIHAAKIWNGDLYDIARAEPFRSALDKLGIRTTVPSSRGKISKPIGMPFGAIVGRLDVVGCYETEKALVTDAEDAGAGFFGGRLLINETEKAFGNYSPGRFAFLCRDAIRFAEPIPFRGMQGLFEVSEEVVRNA